MNKPLYSDTSFNEVYDMLEERLNQTGPITTMDAFEICRHKYSYSTVQSRFKEIMEIMMEQGKVRIVRRGMWEIIKPNMKLTRNSK